MKRRAESQLTKDNAYDEGADLDGNGAQEFASEEEIKQRRIIKLGKRRRGAKKGAATDAVQKTAGFQFAFGGAAPKPNPVDKNEQESNGSSAPAGAFQFSFGASSEAPKKQEEANGTSAPSGGFQFSFGDSTKKSASESATTTNNGGFQFSFGESATKPASTEAPKVENTPAAGSGFAFAFAKVADEAKKNGTPQKEDDKESPATEAFKFSFNPSSAATSSTATKSDESTPASSSSGWDFSFAPTKVLNEEEKNASSTGDSKETKATTSWDFGSVTAGSSTASTTAATKTTDSSATEQYNSPFGTLKGDSSWTEGKDYTPPEDRSSKVDSVKLSDKPRETGEEDEKTIVECPVKLYELVDKEWKERGVGTLKLNEQDKTNARFIMRTKETHTVKLNARLFPGMPHTKQGDKSLILMLHNAAVIEEKPKEGEEVKQSEAEQSAKLSQVLLRTKEGSDISKIYDYIETNYKKE
uniref:RanBD1 domain-containing protein n=1 Tax=Percolomonas cosmopolitus TaxID=63605 RepID=A0A7S1KPS3_9EUKA|mmetsp:Transcript_3704/g.14093  ORF Transcript_3704/g.14093 Transcript_3704/m.14093 type:complete len:471 (+) Transcript_3704:155-1567(+)|eukprot:CAMPEP_0117443868 /NCGR_PEP_ID=MMETSP0759-20121206/4932_1 /TAXON_ID=63605 /ORGANISM="Percolomonas cosmopolitus, Strain WS" /LENGTH=470 /DNA_ID=CAMNT_0005235887 /DNA_START=176 /DNA_END=1588 /DNA_ORIENTATION=+